MKVLVGTLAYRLKYDVVGRIFTQEWGRDGYSVLFEWGGDMQPGEANRFAAITRKYAALQRKFLSGDWDALLVVEDDVLIPTHTLMRLSRLLRDGADIAYGLYVWRYESQHWWNAHPKVEEDADGVPWFWSLTQYPEEAKKHWGKPIQVGGLGLGCTLISRYTLTRLAFRQGREDHCCDTTLALDAQKEGLIQVADLGVACGHRLDSGSVIWPDPNTSTLYRIDKE